MIPLSIFFFSVSLISLKTCSLTYSLSWRFSLNDLKIHLLSTYHGTVEWCLMVYFSSRIFHVIYVPDIFWNMHSMHAKSLQSCLTLCDPMDFSPPGSSVLGFSRQEYWSGMPCPPPGDLPNSGIETTSLMSPALAGGFFTTRLPWYNW